MSLERATTRPLALAEQGMIATPHYLASTAGLRVLLDGGNAVDAAITASAVLCVVYPHMAGIGGDLLALVWDARSGSLRALNAAGRSGAAASWQTFRERGATTMPLYGGASVTVPGTIDGWARLAEAGGSRHLSYLLGPAVAYAEAMPVVGTLADRLMRNRDRLRSDPGAAAVFYGGSQQFAEGQRWSQPALADSLRRIVAEGPQVFYTGEIAESLVATIRAAGGSLDEADFGAHTSTWDEPLFGTFRGIRVAEMPPSTQGVTALQAMALLDGFGPGASDPLGPAAIHLSVECARRSMADRDRWIGDPAFASSAAQRLLDPLNLAAQRAAISRASSAPAVASSIPPRGDTVYVAAADRDGNLVSLLQSLYSPFGSGVMDPRTGVLLHNRGSAFSLDPDSPNRLEPRKRPLHTLIPAMAFRENEPWLVFGTMGGDGQPQTQLQLLAHILDDGMDVQAAIEQPRWLTGQWDGDEPPDALHLESRYPAAVADSLAALGHPIVRAGPWDRRMGHAQAIQMDRANGMYQGGADPRGDGIALGW